MAFTCVVCQEYIEHERGNNPDPISGHGDCCDRCLHKYVIPCRELQIELYEMAAESVGSIMTGL